MLTLQKIHKRVQSLRSTYISKAKRRRFNLGVRALALTEFSSLNGAGRKLGLNRFTGENRIRRLLTDQGLPDQLQQLLVSEALSKRSGYLYCSLDHSQFGPFCIAVLAVSFRRGRAIPVWCQVNVSAAGLLAPLLVALEALFTTLASEAPQLKLVLVMDRWFAPDKLFTLFSKYSVYFSARTKSDKRVQLPWDPSGYKLPIMGPSFLETEVTYRSHKLRLIRSEMSTDMKDPEPWFLLTNLPSEGDEAVTRRQILNRYKERFEIEEDFKDLKWLQRLEWQRVRKPEVIRSLLLFVFLGWWLLWWCTNRRAKDEQQPIHPKKKLSWFRIAWEQLQYLLSAPQLALLA